MTVGEIPEIGVTQQGAVSLVRVHGDLSWANSERLRVTLSHALERSRQTRACVIVELSGVRHMDSSAIATLLEGLQLAAQRRARFMLSGLNGHLHRLLARTRLEALFEIADSEDQALSRAGWPHPACAS